MPRELGPLPSYRTEPKRGPHMTRESVVLIDAFLGEKLLGEFLQWRVDSRVNGGETQYCGLGRIRLLIPFEKAAPINDWLEAHGVKIRAKLENQRVDG